jgi:simple sugar transport system substrate-binding protein
VAATTREKALAVRRALIQRELTVWKGPLKSNQGAVALPAGKQMIASDARLDGMSYLIDGVLGRLPD